MALKNLLYISFILLFLNGCSYKFTSTKQLDALDKRLDNLEENLPQEISENVLQSLTKELDKKLTQQDKDMQLALELYLEHQKKDFEYLKNELTYLAKLKKSIEAKNNKVKQTPIIVQEKTTPSKEKLVVGGVEKVHIYPSNLIMDARIDTGAETSSIDARDIVEFERDGKKWVRFALVDRETDTFHEIERKVVRVIRILQSSLDQKYEKRVVVSLEITIGDKKELSEFTLTNREHMQYPILVGRSILQDVIVVDVSEQYMAPLITEQEKSFKE